MYSVLTDSFLETVTLRLTSGLFTVIDNCFMSSSRAENFEVKSCYFSIFFDHLITLEDEPEALESCSTVHYN